jgi:hypothetical protein
MKARYWLMNALVSRLSKHIWVEYSSTTENFPRVVSSWLGVILWNRIP